MKKLLIATAILSIVPAVHAAPKVYGQLDVGLYNIDKTDSQKSTKVMSNASRFGFKGEDEVGATTSAIYQAEFGISADGDSTTTVGSSSADTCTTTLSTATPPVATTTCKAASGSGIVELKHRNVFVGLKNTQLGAVKIGHHDSYVKLAQAKVDLFNDQAGEDADMKHTFAGENRVKNTLMYESPKFAEAGNIQFNLMLSQGEVQKTDADIKVEKADAGDGKHSSDNGLATGLSTSITAEPAEGLYIGLAADKDIQSKFPANDKTVKTDIVRLVGTYAIPSTPVTVGVLYQTAEPSDAKAFATTSGDIDKETAYLISASIKATDEISLKAQYQASTTDFLTAGSKSIDIDQFGLGVDYNFSEKTAARLMYIDRTKSQSGTKDQDTQIVGVSMLHKF